MSSDGVAVESSARSSSIVWFTRAGVRDLPEGPREVAVAMLRRAAVAARLPESHAEGLNVVRYTATERYELHFDTEGFRDSARAPNRILRDATLLAYLNTLDDNEGGETIFPLVVNKSQAGEPGSGPKVNSSTILNFVDGRDAFETPYVADVCLASEPLTSAALRLRPKVGDAVLFFHHDAYGAFEEGSLHGSCPVVSGSEKWIAQVFFRPVELPW